MSLVAIQSLNEQFLADPYKFLEQYILISQDNSPPNNTLPKEIGIYHFTLVSMDENSVALKYMGGTDNKDAIEAYWLPRGMHIDVPRSPAATPTVIFTPNLEQAILYVDQFNNDVYRVYHVEKGLEDVQYTVQYHGLGKINEIQPADYGTATSSIGFAVLTFQGIRNKPRAKNVPTSASPKAGKSKASSSLYMIAGPLSATQPSAFTVSFCGTACTRDEGEVSRKRSDKKIYAPETGYIPVRIHKEITGDLKAITPSVIVRGVGENDWAVPRKESDPLILNGPLNVPKSLQSYVKNYSGGDQKSKRNELSGADAPALALHGANLAAASGMQIYNFIGHSRGAVEAIMAAWFIYSYGSDDVKHIPINIFAIDPVPGTGEWWGIFTHLPPNVANYVGVYAWDMCVQPKDKPFMGLVPRPNCRMTGKPNKAIKQPNKWKNIPDNYVLTDPLKPGTDPQPTNYELYACRGRHSTVAGNYTADGYYDTATVSEIVVPVPYLIYKMARGYLTEWGTTFQTTSAIQQRVLALRKSINTFHRDFDTMGGGETRTSILPLRPYVRRLSSTSGVNPTNCDYMDEVVSNPPYKMAYPVTSERAGAGWVKWKFL